MTDTMTPEAQAAFLASLGLPTDGKSLASVPTAEVSTEAPAKKAKKKKKEVPTLPEFRPEDMSDVTFDPALLADYKLDGSDIKQASDMLFQHYKYPRGDMRNKLLHRQITEFIARVKRDRNPQPRDGHIKGKVKAGKDQRDLAQMLADHNLDADGLAALLAAVQAVAK